MGISFWKKSFVLLLGATILLGCVKDTGFKEPKSTCASNLVANIGYRDLQDRYPGETVHILEDLILEGYVSSSDQMGNFFGTLHFQDDPSAPTQGFQLDIDTRDTYLLYPIGTKILIKLKGLYLGKSKGVFKIGGQFTSFGNISVGRLPAAIVDQHLFISCDGPVSLEPVPLTLDALTDKDVNTLVRIQEVQFKKEEVGLPFAELKLETKRNLIDCSDRELVVLNSGYADFQAEALPDLHGDVVGVLLRDNQKYQLVIRDPSDLHLEQERCEAQSSQYFFISELADPDNDAAARFVELYNADTAPLNLKGWTLRRYTNANTEVSATILLGGHVVGPGQTFVISPNAEAFESVYGFPADLGVGKNSPADSNGDDNLELVDPFGTVVDRFGVVGEDGTGTDHEFTKGKAVRNVGITQGNALYVFEEWTIYNARGSNGTVNLPQNAPADFTPGIR